MSAFRTTALAAILAVMATTPVLAAEQAVTQPKPVVLDTPPPAQKATQPDMGGPRDAKPAAKPAKPAKKPAAKAATKAKKTAGKKSKKNLKKKKRAGR